MKRVIIIWVSLVSFLFAGIGEVRAIRGEADLIRGAKTMKIAVGTQLQEHDVIRTHAKSKLQIVFNDKTVISLGQKSRFKIDEYLYTDTKVGAKFSVARGLFKSITGRIGKISHKDFRIKTANATIGVRGTTVIGEVSQRRDIIACTSGQIEVMTPKGSQIVNAGERTVVEAMKSPRPPQKMNRVIIKALNKRSDPSVAIVNHSPLHREPKAPLAQEKAQKVTDEAKVSEKFEPWKEPHAKTKKGDNEEPKEEPTQEPIDEPKATTLKDIARKIGTPTPHYSGKITEGSTDFGKIDSANSKVDLDFDLGDGSMQGKMKFSDGKKRYDIGVGGRVHSDGGFRFSPQNGLEGGGSGELKGEAYRKADGTFHFQESDLLNKTRLNQIDGVFETKRK